MEEKFSIEMNKDEMLRYYENKIVEDGIKSCSEFNTIVNLTDYNTKEIKLEKYKNQILQLLYRDERVADVLIDDEFNVDMVFYNKFLKSYVLIDLKINGLKAENLGQMNLYLNYYEQDVNSEDDGKPIGIILCADKDKVLLEYALGGLSNNIFASTYTCYIPNKEQLISEVEKVLKDNKD